MLNSLGKFEMAKIVTLTLNPALDKSTEVDQMIPEQKLRCSPMRLDAGGGGINVSKAIRKLGGETVAVFPCGGHNGNILCDLLHHDGIVVKTVPVDGEVRENVSVRDKSTNAQYRLTMPGLELSENDADQCLAVIGSLKPEYIVASGSLPPGLRDTYFEKVAAFAKSINARFILDTSGKALQAAADEGLYLLKPNLSELSALSGIPNLEMHQVDDAAMEIIRLGKCEIVVVSLGPQGALLVTPQGIEHIPAPTVKKQTTVGAGDSMVAGMVWALSNGKTLREVGRIGVACGSAATMNTGTELFKAADVWRLVEWIETYGERYQIKDFS
ncbi:MAG: 1-phosphofructokinase family hexose kinase [Saprospiraceae bacterium]|nr:1-phosphofructokinase family hexose kinase [Saprospiraceae bacterium]